jgi:hypothetical protein
MAEQRIVLTREDFGTLVSGGEVECGDTKMILQDIGWQAMVEEIKKAYENQHPDMGEGVSMSPLGDDGSLPGL